MKPERQSELDQAWLDALLESTYQEQQPSADQMRIANVMQRLNEPVGQLLQTQIQPQTLIATRSHWFSLRHLSALAIAASLLILAVFVVDTTDRRAYAAVARSAQATPTIRHYKVHMLLQRPWRGQREISANVYIDPDYRYVIEHPSFFGSGTTWLGGDRQQRWLVPPRGPAFIGGKQLLDRWLTRQDAASDYLQLGALLERMGKAYQLSMLTNDAVEVDGGHAVTCTHVRGELKVRRTNLPASIDLWADIKTGVAQKLVLKWPDSGERRGPGQWTIQLAVTPPNLDADWFELKRHAEGRKIIPVRDEKELQRVE